MKQMSEENFRIEAYAEGMYFWVKEEDGDCSINDGKWTIQEFQEGNSKGLRQYSWNDGDLDLILI